MTQVNETQVEGRAEEMPNGAYSTPRTCEVCGDFTTLSRDEFWEHVLTEHAAPESTPR